MTSQHQGSSAEGSTGPAAAALARPLRQRARKLMKCRKCETPWNTLKITSRGALFCKCGHDKFILEDEDETLPTEPTEPDDKKRRTSPDEPLLALPSVPKAFFAGSSVRSLATPALPPALPLPPAARDEPLALPPAARDGLLPWELCAVCATPGKPHDELYQCAMCLRWTHGPCLEAHHRFRHPQPVEVEALVEVEAHRVLSQHEVEALVDSEQSNGWIPSLQVQSVHGGHLVGRLHCPNARLSFQVTSPTAPWKVWVPEGFVVPRLVLG